MSLSDRVRDIVLPILSSHEVELYDFDVRIPLVRVVVDREGGVNLDTLAAVTRAVSRALDDADLITSRYTLEVTSPGVERPLRTPEQFARAVGEVVTLRTLPEVEGERRVRGVLASADELGISVRLDEGEDAVETEVKPEGEAEPVVRTLTYGEIERARTVFEWGAPGPKPGHAAAAPGSSRKKRERSS